MSKRTDALREAIERNQGVDLHSHTIHSDGAWTPEDLIRDAALAGIRVFAVTDHDSVGGLSAAQAAADAKGMILIPGIEVTVVHNDKPFHIHCFDVDHRDPRWAAHATNRKFRYKRYYDDIFDQLAGHGYPIRRETVMTPDGFYVQHPVSTALEKSGHATDFRAAGALLRRLNIRYPWQQLAVTAEEYREIIPPDGGVCVVAHPAREERGVSSRLTETDLKDLRRFIPLVGLEVYHPYHTANDVTSLRLLGEEHGLVTTAGSDAHGFNVNRPPKPHAAYQVVDFLDLILERWDARDRKAA